ncbi:bifunctional oligoribonuclease and PAP phosphatase NrnA [Weizmannia acidilactici]|uniref:Bifunctional oligoribonuclease and PAP phosphatase NrnA n=1 Tax=Weizmannia acidilactici TaxID=2607726 RepID=A0A5J4JEP6_9BACI|nr:bifunctional oligoribonuclease/PAP phosphatase NrnA [Weizmannia acidilactici]GER67004.1 bifunctional oligoribonuclease and PAP phosphatase NrnA [Weizmannia acidilactici]GER70161.1 bifunctional oligoribonuclease and PAP phosphatase NrnA [Weizmannia acidilactici]GER73279.1 bifunctional oligoribonuclease and PAP phosphatase NrnA [Weizmannia acidilactici]
MKSEILYTIQQYETIIVHRHVRPDPDAYGSQGGLAEILKASFPDKKIYLAGDNEPGLAYLNRMDNIPDETYRGALVIVCDTANRERISDQRYNLGEKLIKIDHHPNHDAYGDLQWVDEEASSVSEMIYEFYLSGKEKGLRMTDAAARLIFAGIVGDTGRFLYPSATEKTFDYAGELIRYNFDRTALFNQMYEVEPDVIKLQGYIYQNLEILEHGAAVVVLKKDLIQKFGVPPRDASQLVSTLGDIKGLKAWCFFIEEDDQIRLRFRSKGPVINELARKYNGGGHPLAAGATVYSWDVVEAVKQDLIQLCKEG